MCGPEASLGMTAINTLGSTAGAFSAASGQKAALAAEAAVADTNARLAELTAQNYLRQGQRQEQAKRLEAANRRAGQRVGYASAGVDVNESGSVAAVRASSEILNEIDVATIRANAAQSAWGHRMEAVGYQGEAASARASSKAINPYARAGSALLTGATEFATNRYKFKKEGLLPENDFFKRNFGF